MNVHFDNSYLRLPEKFYTRLDPSPVTEPRTIRVNRDLAEQLGFDPEWLASSDGAEFASGNKVIEGSTPIATVYGGHQFGSWSGQLGDGRAHLLGEVIDEDGNRFDVQLKGSGQTPYSRRGDGRSPIGPVLREYIISEAMHALGIPTTRSLVATATGDDVRRQTKLPGGVLVRVARSHIRVGTFEYFAWRGDEDGIRTLLKHSVERHYPDLDPESPNDFLRAVAERQASLVAEWMLVGFIHGVMNTDNMLVSGETIDYGPCAFMNEYDPATVYSSIDRMGRYAYGNQPAIAQWNISRLAEALLAGTDQATETIAAAQRVVDDFPDLFRAAYTQGFGEKLGIAEFAEDDWELLTDLLELMHEAEADYTLTFARLTELAAGGDGPVAEFFDFDSSFDGWLAKWRERTGDEDGVVERMRSRNPLLIPRNHQVERAIEDAVERGDYGTFERLVDALATPHELPDDLELLRPPAPAERVAATFCGT